MPSPLELSQFRFASPLTLIKQPSSIPDESGVYLFFFRGGRRILSALSYEDPGFRPLLSLGRRTHLYTGAARNLRERLRQHITADLTSSSLRLSLLAVEQSAHALSRSGTPACEVKGERTLNLWLQANATIAFELTTSPFLRERDILERCASPLNIVFRREHPFARRLSRWRQARFPAANRARARRIRYR